MRRAVSSPLFVGLMLLASLGAACAQSAKPPKPDKNAPDPVFDVSPEESADAQNFDQANRPQFHYTPVQGFVGDATGLMYSEGTYHLFYMSDKWERRKNRNKKWGYATCTDLLHWKEQTSVLDPILDNHPGSGSGVVDWNNALGLQKDSHKTLAAFYTDYKTGSCILYSTDEGKTWTRHPRNPVLPRVGASDRDPFVFWYPPAKEWRMARHWEPFNNEKGTGFAFFRSTNLLDWSYLSKMDGFNECPDMFELPLDGNSKNKKWVLMDAGFNYLIGAFDGTNFITQSDKLRADFAASKYIYAPQTWKKDRDGRAAPILMAFLRFPAAAEMPMRLAWYNQMNFPSALSLRTTPGGIRLCRQPIPEIEKLHGKGTSMKDMTLRPGENLLSNMEGDQLDLETDIDLGDASAITLNIRGQPLRYSVTDQMLALEATKAKLPISNKKLHLRVLVDRTSIEVFAGEGEVCVSRVFFFNPAQKKLCLQCEGGTVHVKTLDVHSMKSIWR